ncbi:hypothetical protein RFI_24856 [Reticulomyxa filosa]|uniref:Uncharacterized protein n=1 Tax=Reticulomyxa filosa TaxID=46433 RepID=X6MF58_RETFI|nr:hypothetical protein RFI_24856 [Reticulomyxa filosa]|eukprot:ETO12519.1 hypothetical protein RFI_24856 [Reticulomyxa filosa]
MSNQNVQTLKELRTPFDQIQCVLHKHKLLICGGLNKRACYSYHTLKSEYKFICEYPSDVELHGHYVMKLLSFESNWYKKNKHTLVMKYVSIWNNILDILDILDISNKSNEFNNCNQWTPFTDNHNHPIIIGREMIIILDAKVFNTKKKWIIFKDILPVPLGHCFVILNENNNHIHIIGEGDSGYGTSTNMK